MENFICRYYNHCSKATLSKFVEAIIDNLSKILLDRDCINLKITSTDSVGFIGNSEGIAAQSIATIAKKYRKINFMKIYNSLSRKKKFLNLMTHNEFICIFVVLQCMIIPT